MKAIQETMKTIKTTICIHSRTPEGLLVVRMNENTTENLSYAQENRAAILELKGEEPPMPILVDFSKAAGQDFETRKFYAEHAGEWSNRVALLVESADPNRVDPREGATTLVVAVKDDNLKIAKLLVNYSAKTDVDDGPRGSNLLQIATDNANGEIVEWLHSLGLEPNENKTGPLATAVYNYSSPAYRKITDLLLAKGADPNGKDSYDQPLIFTAL